MAFSRGDPSIQPFILEGVRTKNEIIGSGAYGTVQTLEYGGVKCAGKKIHDILLESSHWDEQAVSRAFIQECKILSDLSHPHVIQFLGLYFLAGSKLPLLVMEYLPHNLDDCLSTDIGIPLPVKTSILCDTARGLTYLHQRSPPIIHRDLTAKNVLLSSNMHAKIADFGVARIVNIQPSKLSSTMTAGPGAIVYMPPEAMGTKPRYGTSLDIFSFGVLTLYTISQKFPIPEAATTVDSEGKVVALTEIQRRAMYMQEVQRQLGANHTFEGMISQCLANKIEERPTARTLLGQLDGLKAQLPNSYRGWTWEQMVQHLSRKRIKVPNSVPVHQIPNTPKRTFPIYASGTATHSQRATFVRLFPYNAEFREVVRTFEHTWAPTKGLCPSVSAVFSVRNPALEERFQEHIKMLRIKRSPSHTEQYFHGTKLTCNIMKDEAVCWDRNCGICGITREGFNENYIASNIPTWMRFGYGMYLAPNSSKCHEYTQGAFDYRAMLVCDVAPGKKIVIAPPTDDTYKELTKPPQGYDSIYGQGGCLNFEEIVVYECEKLMPRYVIVYQKDGICQIAKNIYPSLECPDRLECPARMECPARVQNETNTQKKSQDCSIS